MWLQVGRLGNGQAVGFPRMHRSAPSRAGAALTGTAGQAAPSPRRPCRQLQKKCFQNPAPQVLSNETHAQLTFDLITITTAAIFKNHIIVYKAHSCFLREGRQAAINIPILHLKD